MSVKALENAKNNTVISYKENASPSHVADSMRCTDLAPF